MRISWTVLLDLESFIIKSEPNEKIDDNELGVTPVQGICMNVYLSSTEKIKAYFLLEYVDYNIMTINIDVSLAFSKVDKRPQIEEEELEKVQV